MFLCLTALYKEWGDLSVLILTEMKICIPSMSFGMMAEISSGFLFLIYVKSVKDRDEMLSVCLLYHHIRAIK